MCTVSKPWLIINGTGACGAKNPNVVYCDRTSRIILFIYFLQYYLLPARFRRNSRPPAREKFPRHFADRYNDEYKSHETDTWRRPVARVHYDTIIYCTISYLYNEFSVAAGTRGPLRDRTVAASRLFAAGCSSGNNVLLLGVVAAAA